MTKHEFAKELTNRVEDVSIAQAEVCIDAIFDILEEVLNTEGRYNHKNFGTFQKVLRAERKGRNPLTGEQVVVPAQYGIKFTTASAFKNKINGKI